MWSERKKENIGGKEQEVVGQPGARAKGGLE